MNPSEDSRTIEVKHSCGPSPNPSPSCWRLERAPSQRFCGRQFGEGDFGRAVSSFHGVGTVAFAFALLCSIPTIPIRGAESADRAAETDRSATIDRMIEQALATAGQQPNRLVDDATFLRRAYLDIIGRIPTLEEAQAFLSSQQLDKRAQLVDQLLQSPGYPLHQFTFWADLLRAKSSMQGGPADFYTAWIKACLKENKPYDQWVREMLTARGYIWSTPATGYFQRDQGMPLDNMANTVRVFLGTRLECAQCHNDPLETWTRRDFYRMAAYRHHLSTVLYHESQWPAMQDILDQRDASKEVRTWASRTFAFMKRRVYDAERELRLPEDYDDQDAQPGQVVEPATIFGAAACAGSDCDRQRAFAEWLTSPESRHFTTVIVNRMWKKVMGRGLIEPVDDMHQFAAASHPELLRFLEQGMVDLEYDLRKFQRVLYQTRAYQREVDSADLTDRQDYLFPGPLLKRMSAEQLWDSLVTLMAPEIDLRQGKSFRSLAYLRENLNAYEQATPAELVDAAYQAAEVRRLNNETRDKIFALENKIAAAEASEDSGATEALRNKIAKLEHYRDHEIPIRIDGRTWVYRTEEAYRQAQGVDPAAIDAADGYWANEARDWCVRAAELSSPAEPDHPLRTFGQSDREQVDNASTSPTIPLVLSLMNHELFQELFHAESVLSRNLEATTSPAEQVNVLYLTLLSRFPTTHEAKAMAAAQEQIADRKEAVEDIAWALINTREFLFIR